MPMSVINNTKLPVKVRNCDNLSTNKVVETIHYIKSKAYYKIELEIFDQ